MNIADKIKELFSHFFIYGLGSIAQSVASFILLPIITSNINPDQYGVYTMINLAGLLAGTVFYLGVTSALPRSYFDHKEENQRNIVLSTSFFLIMIGALLQILLGAIFQKTLSKILFGNFEYSTHLFLMFIATAVGFLNTFFQTYLRLLNKSKMVICLGICASIINIAVVFVMLKVYNYGIWAPIYGYLIAQCLIFIFTLIKIKDKPQYSPNIKEIQLLLKFGIPVVLSSFAVMGIEWSDRFFINKYLTLADVGIYSLAYKIGSTINSFYVGPFVQIWNPLMMKHRTSDDIHNLLKKVLTYYFIAGSIFLLGTTAFANELAYALIKNQAYFKGLTIAPIIMAGILIYGATNIVTAGLFYSRNITAIPVIYTIVALLNLILNYALIPYFGYKGAAWASFLTYLAIPPLIYLKSVKHFSFEVEISKLIYLTVISTIGILCLFFTEANQSIFLRILFKMIVILISIGIIALTMFSFDDRKKFISFITRFRANYKNE